MPHKMAMKTEWENVPALLNENMLCFNEGSAVIITSNNMTMITNYYSCKENLDMPYGFAYFMLLDLLENIKTMAYNYQSFRAVSNLF